MITLPDIVPLVDVEVVVGLELAVDIEVEGVTGSEDSMVEEVITVVVEEVITFEDIMVTVVSTVLLVPQHLRRWLSF